jgi:hypothetical protein
LGFDENQADQIFFEQNFGKSSKRTAAALAVKLQKEYRKLSAMPQKKGLSKSERKKIRKQKKKIGRALAKAEARVRAKPLPSIPPMPRRSAPRLGKMGKTKIAFASRRDQLTTTHRPSKRRERGWIDLGAVVGTTSNVAGDVLMQIGLNLQDNTLAVTPLAYLSALWEKWVPRKLIFEFEYATAATDSGQLVLWVDPDPKDVASTGPDRLNRALYSQMHKQFHVSSPGYVYLDYTPKLKDLLYIDPNSDTSRFYSAGNFYVLVSGVMKFSGDSSKNLGRMRLYYDVEFQFPTLEKVSSAVSTATITQFYDTTSSVVFTTTAVTYQSGTASFDRNSNTSLKINSTGSFVIVAFFHDTSAGLDGQLWFDNFTSGGSVDATYYATASSASRYITGAVITVTVAGAILNVSGSGWTVSGDTHVNVFLCKVNDPTSITEPPKKTLEERMKSLESVLFQTFMDKMESPNEDPLLKKKEKVSSMAQIPSRPLPATGQFIAGTKAYIS